MKIWPKTIKGVRLHNEVRVRELWYFETSAKTGQNVQEALDEIAKITYLKWKVTKDSRHSIRISSADSVGKVTISEKKGCC